MAFKIYFKIYIKELENHSHLVYNLKLEEIKEVSMENIYFISDTHFGHWFAVWFWNRPFKNIREMNNVLIDNWNSRIKDEDVVVIVGDFFAGNKLFSKYLLKNLNGDKIFIKGNHDFKFRYKKLLDSRDIKIYNRIEFSLNDNHFILTHKPMKNVPDDVINIHGHHHRKLLPSKYKKDRYFNVAVDHNDYKPISIDEIVEYKLGETNVDKFSIIEQIKYSNLNRKYAISLA